jgi:hypothetical protein
MTTRSRPQQDPEAADDDERPRTSKRARNGPGTLPDNPLVLFKEPSGTTQIATWNVAGLRSCNAEKWKVKQAHDSRQPGKASRTDEKETPPPARSLGSGCTSKLKILTSSPSPK